jgi:SAM-dependent methyltransferase
VLNPNPHAVAARSDRAWGPVLDPVRRAVLELAAPRPGMRLVEGAAGSGLTSMLLGRAVGPRGCVVATDPSAAMVSRARSGMRTRGFHWVRTAQADLLSLPFPDGAFHQGVCVLGVEFTRDPSRALSELVRVIRPGGRVVVAVWGPQERVGWSEIVPLLNAHAGWKPPCPWFALGEGDELARRLVGVGTRKVEVQRLTLELAFAGPGAALEAVFEAGPAGAVGNGVRVGRAHRRFGRNGVRVREAWLRSIAPFRWRRGYRIPGEVLVAVAESN